MKTIIQLLALTLTLCGCATFHENAGKTLATTNLTVDAALNGWFTWVKQGHATVEQELVVEAAYERYQYALKASRAAYIASGELQDKSLFTKTAGALMASMQHFVNLVESFTSRKIPLPTNPVNPPLPTNLKYGT